MRMRFTKQEAYELVSGDLKGQSFELEVIDSFETNYKDTLTEEDIVREVNEQMYNVIAEGEELIEKALFPDNSKTKDYDKSMHKFSELCYANQMAFKMGALRRDYDSLKRYIADCKGRVDYSTRDSKRQEIIEKRKQCQEKK